jgi:hypothetical protein
MEKRNANPLIGPAKNSKLRNSPSFEFQLMFCYANRNSIAGFSNDGVPIDG